MEEGTGGKREKKGKGNGREERRTVETVRDSSELLEDGLSELASRSLAAEISSRHSRRDSVQGRLFDAVCDVVKVHMPQHHAGGQ
jgi:hypothetical protein